MAQAGPYSPNSAGENSVERKRPPEVLTGGIREDEIVFPLPSYLLFRAVLAIGIVFAGAGGAICKPKVKTVCGKVVTIRCEKDTQNVSLMLQPSSKDQPVFVDLAWDNTVATAERYEGADICATGVEQKRKSEKYLHLEEPALLQVKRDPPATQARFGAAAHRMCEAGIESPVLIQDVRPNYTRAAMDAKIQGSVLLEAVVQADGRVGDTRVIRSLDTKHGLDREAIRASQGWVFKPAQLNGSPVALIVTLEMTFTLK